MCDLSTPLTGRDKVLSNILQWLKSTLGGRSQAERSSPSRVDMSRLLMEFERSRFSQWSLTTSSRIAHPEVFWVWTCFLC